MKFINMKKILYVLSILLIFSACGTKDRPGNTVSRQESFDENESDLPYLDTSLSPEERAEDLLSRMTLEDKAAQMVQVEIATAKSSIDFLNGIGSVLSGGGATPSNNTPDGWTKWITEMQASVMNTALQIPAIYGIDAVHGHANVKNSTVFPHNIGLGAANDPALVEKMGEIVAEEMFLTRIPWNFGPCVAIAEDPRWGRSYESYSTNIERTTALATAYFKGFRGVGGVATAKHYLGDGNTVYGTGINRGIDRGDTKLSTGEIRETILIPYKALVDSGVRVVMTSFSGVNGTKMHAHKELITDILKGELGFKGFVITDWEGLQEIPKPSYKEQVWAAVNAGNDMLMEPYQWNKAKAAIVEGVENGEIDIERVDDAVRRILIVKFDAGLFEDPILEQKVQSAKIKQLRDPQSLEVARQLVEKSLVLLKNDNSTLPIKKGQKILLIGPAKNNIGIQCGGWTITWQGEPDRRNKLTEGTTIEESLQTLSEEMGFELITDESRADEADTVIIALGEKPYSEMQGDVSVPSLTEGNIRLSQNNAAIETAKKLGKPTVALIVAGRQVAIDEFLPDWDAVVMAYLPGTEGDGIGRVLTGKVNFSGTLPMPWYKKLTGGPKENFRVLFDYGYGLKY